MEKDKRFSVKSPIPKGKISIIELIEKVKKEEGLSKFDKMRKIINIAFKKIYNIQEDESEKKEKLIREWEKYIS